MSPRGHQPIGREGDKVTKPLLVLASKWIKDRSQSVASLFASSSDLGFFGSLLLSLGFGSLIQGYEAAHVHKHWAAFRIATKKKRQKMTQLPNPQFPIFDYDIMILCALCRTSAIDVFEFLFVHFSLIQLRQASLNELTAAVTSDKTALYFSNFSVFASDSEYSSFPLFAFWADDELCKSLLLIFISLKS